MSAGPDAPRTQSVLIVEDERLIRWSLRERLQRDGYAIDEAETIQSAIERFQTSPPDVVLLDYRLPDGSAPEFLAAIGEWIDSCVVIIISAFGTVETAVAAIKQGVFDFVAKPFNVDELARLIERALESTRLKRELVSVRRALRDRHGFERIIGDSPPMRELFETLRRVAESPATTVLLRGESGTGKDLVARTIHDHSARASKPFVNITCTALTETLLESELFGHERGAFTGARVAKKGLFELADGGTAFLDEIGDMPAALQAKLLRFVEEKVLRRVGGTQDIRIDVRIIAATNRNIERAIEQGQFRRDLFYRLNVVGLSLPPLRDRGQDICLLASHFAQAFARDLHKPCDELADSAVALLQRYRWPGNVRELRNVVERAVLLSHGRRLTAADFSSVASALETEGGYTSSGEYRFKMPAEGLSMDEIERDLITQALAMTNNNQTHAAKLLRLSRDQLRYRLEKFGLT
ncbi:MAG: sigma-54 dependent transcriptional regulator [Phycisphaerae bacterium]